MQNREGSSVLPNSVNLSGISIAPGPILTTPTNLNTATPLYRGDTRDYVRIFEKGMEAKGKNTNLARHLYHFGEDSAFISTSTSREVAASFPNPLPKGLDTSYVYEIQSHAKVVDPAAELNSTSFGYEKEKAFAFKIKPEEIKGCWEIKITRTDPKVIFYGADGKKINSLPKTTYTIREEFIPNPHFKKPIHPAQTIWKVSGNLSKVLTGVSLAIDSKNLHDQYQISKKTGNYDNTYRKAAETAGGWAGAMVAGTALSKAGVVACAPLSPYGSAACGVVGGLIGSVIGYYGGSVMATKIYDLNGSQSNLISNKKVPTSSNEHRDWRGFHFATMNNQKKLVELMISRGVDINIKGYEDFTALHLAARCENYDLINLLIANGADVNAKTIKGETARNLAMKYEHKQKIENRNPLKKVPADYFRERDLALYDSTWKNDLVGIENALKQGANINIKSPKMGLSLLHIAACNGQKEIVLFFLSHGIDVNVFDTNDRSPLFFAVHEGQLSTIKLLLAEGTKINLPDKRLWTALHIAAYDGRIKTMKLLIANGADLSLKTIEGDTIRNIAMQNESEHRSQKKRAVVPADYFREQDQKLIQAYIANDETQMTQALSNGANPIALKNYQITQYNREVELYNQQVNLHNQQVAQAEAQWAAEQKEAIRKANTAAITEAFFARCEQRQRTQLDASYQKRQQSVFQNVQQSMHQNFQQNVPKPVPLSQSLAKTSQMLQRLTEANQKILEKPLPSQTIKTVSTPSSKTQTQLNIISKKNSCATNKQSFFSDTAAHSSQGGGERSRRSDSKTDTGSSCKKVSRNNAEITSIPLPPLKGVPIPCPEGSMSARNYPGEGTSCVKVIGVTSK